MMMEVLLSSCFHKKMKQTETILNTERNPEVSQNTLEQCRNKKNLHQQNQTNKLRWENWKILSESQKYVAAIEPYWPYENKYRFM